MTARPTSRRKKPTSVRRWPGPGVSTTAMTTASSCPACTSSSTGCCSTPTRRSGRSLNVPDSPDSPAVTALGLAARGRRGRRAGRTAASGHQRRLLRGDLRRRRGLGLTHRQAPERAGLLVPRAGHARPRSPRAPDGCDEPGGTIVVAPLERGCILPSVKLALLAEADLTGRRRTHRPPRPRRRDAQRFFEDLKVGDHVVHHTTVSPASTAWSSGRWAASSATTCCSSTAATTSSTCRRTRSTRSGSTPVARPRRSTRWAAPTSRGPRPRCAPRSPRSPRSWWCSTRPASPARPCVRARHPLAARDGAGLPVPGDRSTSCPRSKR